MSKKIYGLLLAPLLYTACNTATVSPQEVTKTKAKATVLEKDTVTTTVKKAPSKEITVNFIQNKPLIQDQGMMHIESFMQTLQPTLKGLLKDDPTHVTAMGGCTSMAMKMTQEYNDISDTKIRRTALKYRNEKNKPDATDTVVMERFLASNDLKKPLVVEMSDHYRVYKALPSKPACLLCHGDVETISPKILKMIKETYPKDLATGFKLNEFRGTVVAKVTK